MPTRKYLALNVLLKCDPTLVCADQTNLLNVHVNLLIQPEAGISPLVDGIQNAKKSIEIAIFRFDRAEIEAGLKAAVARGVAVSAIIAYTNRGGEINLRKLEMRLLEVGVVVSRTASDLLRYHNKLMIVDRRDLYMLSFNFTHLDIDHSRGFGIVTRNHKLVQEAAKLFEADTLRQPYKAGMDTFVVSPVNSRRVIAALLRKAKRQLLIYDPQIDDLEMIKILIERAKAGVEVKVIGRMKGDKLGIDVKDLAGLLLHTRTIIVDEKQAFVGSQSLRGAELDSRREVGLIVTEPKLLKGLLQTFHADWARPAEEPNAAKPKALKKAVKSLVQELSPLNPLVMEAVKQVAEESGNTPLDLGAVKATVKEAVKELVRERIEEIVNDAVGRP